MAETEIQQIKKEYISDRIKESIDVFGNQPERFGTILMSAVAVLAILISKILQKARELSTKLFDTEQMPVQKPVRQPAEKETLGKPKIPPKPVIPAEAANYPKLVKIYKELKRQNEIIFEAEKERNTLEFERDDLKGFAKLIRKGELQGRIDRKNEEIEILKVGLSGIAKRYGYQNVQDFYRVYNAAKNTYADYQNKVVKWEETYGTKAKSDTLHDRIQSYQKDKSARQSEQIARRKDRGAR